MVKAVSLALFCAIFLFAPNIPSALAEVDEDIEEFFEDLEEAFSEIDTYKCLMDSKHSKGRRRTEKVSMLYFKKPNLIRLDVLKGRKKGSRVVLNKRGKIRGRNTIGFKKTLRPTDKRLKNVRGTTFLEATFEKKIERIKKYIFEMGLNATLTEEEYMGREVYRLHIDVDGKDPKDPITDEDLWFDKETFMFLKDLKFEGDEEVANVKWSEHEIDIDLPDSLFEM